jgi:hypothetical protein
MRGLRIVCGICVLFSSLAYAHLVHHHARQATQKGVHHPVALVAAGIAGTFSFVGGILLLKGGK